MCRTHANEEYRAGYAAQGGAGIRAQKYARKRRLTIIPPDWRAERIDEFGGRCAYGCGRPATTLDHVWPVAGGGRSIPSNLVPACGPCNSRKRHGDPEPWIARGMAAYPALWAETIALANEHGEDWTEAA
ncbi:MAG: HNH endonuclease [Acidimicrobiales bacterium]